MTSKKISDLTAVTTPADTDEFEVVQAGTNKRETRAQIVAGSEPTQTAGSQAEVEAGTESAIRSFSPLRIFQAIAAWILANVQTIIDDFLSEFGTKATPTTDDFLFIADAADGNTGKIITLGDIPSPGFPVSTAREVASAAFDNPTSGDWVQYSNSSGVLVVLNGALEDDGEAVLQALSGAGTLLIVCSNTYTINEATGAAASTTVSDLVVTGSSGADTTWTSAGGNLPTLVAGDYVELRNHSTAANNGWYVVTTFTSTSDIDLTKLVDTDTATLTNPADASSESADVDEPVALTLETIATIKRTGTDFIVQGGTDGAKLITGDVTLNRSVIGGGLVNVTRSTAGTEAGVVDSGKYIISGGAWTIPNTAIGDGWFNCLWEVGADTHDPTFNSDTLDISVAGFTAGEVYMVVVKSASTIKIQGPAGVFDQTDFA